MKWQFWLIHSFYCMLCCSDSESKLWMHVSSWMTSSSETCVQFGVSILDTQLTDTVFICWNAQNIHSSKVILCISSSKTCYYKKQIIFLILFWTELGQAENFLIAPRISHHFWNTAIYWPKISEFSYPPVYEVDWLSMVLRLRQHNIGYTADGFYRSDDPTNSVKALKEGG